MRPFFSVIIPSLNEEKYLPVICTSLSEQSFRDFEVILVDGNSSDGTVGIFHKFQRFYPQSRVILSQRRNVAYQRNKGGRQARGKFLIFFDADVNISTVFLEEIYHLYLERRFVLATTWVSPDSEKSLDKLMLLFGNLGQELAKGINKPFSGGYNTIIEKNVFHKLHGYREDLSINEDHEFAIRAMKHGIKLEIIKDPQVVMSLRRFRSQGALKVLKKYAQAQYYQFINVPVTAGMIEYPMGGHVHKKRDKADFISLENYINTVIKVQEKLSKLFSFFN